ncbi:hypothetical protein BB559_002429 [Furculomyces boomerangus]|uniref:Mitochondrial carrier protein n=1 Tax=Furculomyces boomerangus TaxID=61424 RepID=A0A2T9YV91_9FUNG|nr:hypothetical protein BB559_002429 [Furculomyces boomerangus]
MTQAEISTVKPANPVAKKPTSWKNIALGAAIQTFEVSSLGQPFEVVKTQMAANRGQNLRVAIKETYKNGGIKGFYRGLIPWAWIEASTKGGVLLFASSEIEYVVKKMGYGGIVGGLLGGMGGGIAQAYTTMGFCTFMKTVEVTRHRQVGEKTSTFRVAYQVFQKEGIAGLNRGVSAVAIRQMTNWGSRFVFASVVGGSLSCWNQPIEVIRVEMQSQIKNPDRPKNLNVVSTAKYIYEKNGFRGFYRGVIPRIGLSVYLTTCMVFGGDSLKEYFGTK